MRNTDLDTCVLYHSSYFTAIFARCSSNERKFVRYSLLPHFVVNICLKSKASVVSNMGGFSYLRCSCIGDYSTEKRFQNLY